MKKTRKHYAAKEKVAILRRHLLEQAPISLLCEESVRQRTVFYRWPFDCVPVAVEFLECATPLPRFLHPKRAFYVLGAEDATLGENVFRRCKHVVITPTNYGVNLAAAVSVVLYDRLSKGHPN